MIKIYLSFTLIVLSLISCSEQEISAQTHDDIVDFQIINQNDTLPSTSQGSVSNGKLINGKLVPFKGENFQYFDTNSYLGSRAFVNELVLHAITRSYEICETTCPKYTFTLMECSNKNGGKLWPHRTHQNGMSVDFAMPLQKKSHQFDSLDLIGTEHYMLDFNNNGTYSSDSTVSIDFEIVARHILALNEVANFHGLKIKKVIIKTELKDDLFATKSGKKLKEKGIYIVKKLTPLINQLHDDHYHVDFEIID